MEQVIGLFGIMLFVGIECFLLGTVYEHKKYENKRDRR